MPSSIENSRDPGAPERENKPDPSVGTPPAAAARQPWVRPRLECFGDVRQVTMGGSPGQFESNNPGQRRPRTN